MKGFMDWVYSQLLSNSLAASSSSTPFPPTSSTTGFSPNEPTRSSVAGEETTSVSASGNQQGGHDRSLQRGVDVSCQSDETADEKGIDSLAKIENLRIKFFRFLRRFGLSQENLLVAKVLYRVHVAASIRASDSDLKRIGNDKAKAVAAEQEVSGEPELKLSVRILVLGRTGVGKSATINSILNQSKTATNAFHPATKHVQEVVGTVNGVKITFIDTPGLLPASVANARRNRKLLLSVRRCIRKSPPDIILFCERLDLVNIGYSDLPLVKLMTEVFGTAFWFNTIIVMTHASSTLSELVGGYHVNYDYYVSQCTDVIQHAIHQAVFDENIENPVLLVENHPQCEKNVKGEATLPNGQVWKRQFFLLCICTKFLGDINALLNFQDSIKLGPAANLRMPSLPHLLSSLLQHRAPTGPSDSDRDIDAVLLADEEGDEYDELPSIRILTKSQFERLSRDQKNEYLDELDYRETLYLKKQLKEEARIRKQKHDGKESVGADDNFDDQLAPPEAVLLPEMAVPVSFDSDCPSHRYRHLVTSDQWIVRPVLDPQGWDHDVGFDGINLETTAEPKKNAYVLIAGQMSKDKHEFNIQSECAGLYVDDARGRTYFLGLDIQSAAKDMVYTARSNIKLKTLKNNVTDCGVSITSFGGRYYVGAKIEDSILLKKRLKLLMNSGLMRGNDQAAIGGTLEATIRGSDYPARNENIALSLTAISFKKETVLSGGIQSEFRLTRGMAMSLNVNINTQKMGKISLKMSTSEHVEIAVIAIFSILKALINRNSPENRTDES